MDGKTVLFIRNIKSAKRDQFKTATVRRGSNMTQEIRKFIDAYIRSEGKIMTSVEKVR